MGFDGMIFLSLLVHQKVQLVSFADIFSQTADVIQRINDCNFDKMLKASSSSFDTANPPCQTTGYFLSFILTFFEMLSGRNPWSRRGSTMGIYILTMDSMDVISHVHSDRMFESSTWGGLGKKNSGTRSLCRGSRNGRVGTYKGRIAGQMDRDLMEWDFTVFCNLKIL